MTKALVLYHSQEFGNTAEMAQAIADGLREGGCAVDLFNTNDGRFDVTSFPQYDCVAFGSPDYYSYIAGGLKMFMDDHYICDVHKKLKGLRDKPFVLFYSHGGGGNVKDIMPRIFGRIGTLIGEPVGSMGRPDQNVLERCKALGRELASAVF
jgi:flavorubredoxin